MKENWRCRLLAPTLDTFTLTSLSVTLFAALSGSLHCVVMCGPIRMISGNSFFARSLYQLGRLLGYAILGIFAGYLGQSIPLWILLIFLALGIVFSLVPYLPIPFWRKFRSSIIQLSSSHPFLLGFSAALLPCGMLHAWVGVAAVTGNPFLGSLVLLMLWLGTLPALELSSSVLMQPLQKLRRKFPRILTGGLILLAAIPIVWRYSFIDQQKPVVKTECPMHKQ